MKTKNLLFFLMVSLFYAPLGFAQDTAATEAKEEEQKPVLSVSGYIDSYYLTAFNRPKSGNLMGSGNTSGPYFAGRAFDRLTNQFALGLVQTKFTYSDKHVDIVADLTFGPNAELGNFGNQRPTAGGYATGFFPSNGNQGVLYGTSAAIKQAYFTWKATSKFSLTVGQFGTHIGYEVIDAPINYHYSLSNLFNNGPFYHIGAKANYTFSDNVALMVGIVNNWDALTDWKTQKSAIAQLYIKPVDGWNVYLNYIGGHNDDGFKSGAPGSTVGNAAYPGYPTSGYNRQLFDLTTGYQITEKFYIGLNAAYGWYKFSGGSNIVTDPFDGNDKTETEFVLDNYTKMKPTWGGVAFYTNYAISDVFGIGVRYEHFSDKYGVRYISATNNSLTVTLPITLAEGKVIIKPEFRADGSPTNIYEDKDGNATNTQSTLGLAFIGKF